MADFIVPACVWGTAQLGLAYGIANVSGKPTDRVRDEIVTAALGSGYSWFDTAQAYGDSESGLGASFLTSSVVPTVVTKLHPDLDPCDASGIVDAIAGSCRRLGISSLLGVMLHRAEWLDFWELGLREGLLRAQEMGLVSRLGVSVYSPEELDRVLDMPSMTIAQVPLNAWDPRFVNSDVLIRAKEQGVLCFLRSVYLQGLLLMSPDQVGARLPVAREMSVVWHDLCETLRCTPQQLAVRYARRFGCSLVIGVETITQVHETVTLMEDPMLSEEDFRLVQERLHPLAKKEIVNPVNWSVK